MGEARNWALAAPGHLVRFALLPWRARDLAGMPDLLGGLEFGAQWRDSIEAQPFGAAGS